jgi:hypothetical protein
MFWLIVEQQGLHLFHGPVQFMLITSAQVVPTQAGLLVVLAAAVKTEQAVVV